MFKKIIDWTVTIFIIICIIGLLYYCFKIGFHIVWETQYEHRVEQKIIEMVDKKYLKGEYK